MKGPPHKDLRAPILYVGGGPLLLYFPGKEPPHKEVLGWDPDCGIFGVLLYVYVLFSALERSDPQKIWLSRCTNPCTYNSQECGSYKDCSMAVWLLASPRKNCSWIDYWEGQSRNQTRDGQIVGQPRNMDSSQDLSGSNATPLVSRYSCRATLVSHLSPYVFAVSHENRATP